MNLRKKCLIGFCGGILAAVAGYGSVQSTALLPVKDAYVISDQPNSNFGSDVNLRAHRATEPWTKSWIQFDANQISSDSVIEIESITAEITQNGNTFRRGGRLFLLEGLGANDWLENEITWNNAPGNITTNSYTLDENNFTVTDLGLFDNGSFTGEAVNFSFYPGGEAALINALNSGDRLITLVLVRIGNDNTYYASKESPTATQPIQIAVKHESSVGRSLELTLERSTDLRSWSPVYITPDLITEQGTINVNQDGDREFFRLQINAQP